MELYSDQNGRAEALPLFVFRGNHGVRGGVFSGGLVFLADGLALGFGSPSVGSWAPGPSPWCRGFRGLECWRVLEVAMVLQAGTRGMTTSVAVLLGETVRVGGAVDGGCGDAGGGLVDGGGDDDAGGEGRRVDDEEEEAAMGGGRGGVYKRAVLCGEEEEAGRLMVEEGVLSTTSICCAEHPLTNDGFDVLVGDGHALQTVDLLDFVDEVLLESMLAEDFQNVVRVAGTSMSVSPARRRSPSCTLTYVPRGTLYSSS